MIQLYFFKPDSMVLPDCVQVLNTSSSKGPSDPDLAGVEGKVLLVQTDPMEFAKFVASTDGVYISYDPSCKWIKFEITPETMH